MERKIKIAIAGNPNSGKSTIFNCLTGGHQHVGNYPGVTVEKKEGSRRFRGFAFDFIDLPGTYSLTARSTEELVARNFIIDEKPRIIINVVDASHIERNLYLTTQLLELEAPVVLVLNMSDISESQGHFIDIKRLSTLIGVPVVRTVGNKKEGIEELLNVCADYAEGRISQDRKTVKYGDEIELEIRKIEDLIDRAGGEYPYPKRWLALKLLENDSQVCESVKKSLPKDHVTAVFDQVDKSSLHLKKIFDEEPAISLIDKRYGFISGAHTESAQYTSIKKHDYSDAADIVLIHPLFGLPIFLFVMWLLFTATFKGGEPFVKLIEAFFGFLSVSVSNALPDGLLKSAVVDGVISGVGGVVAFLPNIMILYLFISVLEDTGYMSRAAFIMDNFMHRIGLHGKSFIPLVIGFGCSVPAVMSTRILETRKDRLTTMLIIPFMSCSAKLPIYALMIGAFFPAKIGGHVLFSVYLLGIVLAVMASKIFSRYLFKEETTPFVMELPPYTIPTTRGVLLHMWRRAWLYLKKAGTIILGMSLLLWLSSNFPKASGDSKERLEKSFTGHIGKAVSPLMKPVGLDDWKVSVALLSGFAAKEVVVSSLGTLYSMTDTGQKSRDLRTSLKNDPFFSPLVAYVLMVFILLASPCLATLAVIRQETKSWRWPFFTLVYTTSVAWIVCLLIYQCGRFLGIGI